MLLTKIAKLVHMQENVGSDFKILEKYIYGLIKKAVLNNY